MSAEDNGAPRKISGDQNTTIANRKRIAPWDSALDLWAVVPRPANGQARTPWNLTAAHGEENILIATRAANVSREISVRTLDRRTRPRKWEKPDARGSSWEIAESKNRPLSDRRRIFSSNSALELRGAVPDPITLTGRGPRKLTEAKNRPTPMGTEYAMGIFC